MGIAAAVTRAIYLWQVAGTLPASTLILDGRVFDEWAQRIVAGDWLGTEVFYQAPLYPYFLAAIYSVAGHYPLIVRFVQAALSVGSCGMLAWAGRRFFNVRVGVIAGLMLAVYPPALFFDGIVQKAALDLWFMTLLLMLLGEILLRRTWPWLIGAGAILGAFTLSRDNAAIIFPFVVVWLWRTDGCLTRGRRLGQVGVFTAGFVLILLPVVARNYYLGGEAVVTTSFGPNFYIGNHAGATGRYQPLVADRADPRFERADAVRLAEQTAGSRLSMRQASSYWLARAFHDIGAQPGAWVKLLGFKLFMIFNATELEDGEGIDVYADYSSLLRVLYAVLNFGTIFPLAVFGVWMTRREWRRLILLYGIVLCLAGSTMLFFVFARFRFTFVPILMLFAAAGLDALPAVVSSWNEHRWLRTCGPGVLFAGAALVVSNRPLPFPSQTAVTYVNLGMGLLADGKPAEAIEPLQTAIAKAPAATVPYVRAGAYLNLGQALLATHRDDEAVASYEQALQYVPNFGMAHAALGHYYFQKQLPDKALPHLSRAVDLVPELPWLRIEYAQVLIANNDRTGAVAQFREGLRRDPTCVDCANNLAWLLATSADPAVRNGSEAVALAEQVNRRMLESGQSWPPILQAKLLGTLAAAYAETGRYDEATKTIQRAIDIVDGLNAPGVADELQARSRLYQARQPYRE